MNHIEPQFGLPEPEGVDFSELSLPLGVKNVCLSEEVCPSDLTMERQWQIAATLWLIMEDGFYKNWKYKPAPKGRVSKMEIAHRLGYVMKNTGAFHPSWMDSLEFEAYVKLARTRRAQKRYPELINLSSDVDKLLSTLMQDLMEYLELERAGLVERLPAKQKMDFFAKLYRISLEAKGEIESGGVSFAVVHNIVANIAPEGRDDATRELVKQLGILMSDATHQLGAEGVAALLTTASELDSTLGDEEFKRIAEAAAEAVGAEIIDAEVDEDE